MAAFYKYYKWSGYTGGGALQATTSAEADVTVKFDWAIAEQSIVYNYSVINYTASITCHNTDIGLGDHDTLRISTRSVAFDNVVDVSATDEIHLKAGQTATLCTGSTTLYHDEGDGTETPTIKVLWRLYRVYEEAEPANYIPVDTSYSFTDSIVIDPIPRHAIIDYSAGKEVQNFNDEVASVAINYAVPSGMTGYIYLSLDGNENTESTHLEAVTGVGTRNYSFSANDRRNMWALLDQGLDNKQVRFFIKTTNENGTVFREPSNWVNLTIVNYMPTLNPSVVDSNPATIALTGDPEKLIRYASTAKFTTGAEAKKHYSIATEYCAAGGGNPIYGATGEIPNIATNYFTFSATDNAGRQVQTGHEVPAEYGYWIEYIKLTCSASTTEMTADGDVAITVKGMYFNGSFGAQSNALKITCTYSENNGEPQVRTYENVTPTMDGDNYSYTFTLDGLNYLSVYEVQITAEDKVRLQPAVANIVVASTPIFDWGRTDFAFNVPVTILGDSVPTLVEQGTDYSGWSYRKWSDGLYECWQRKVIPAMIGNDSSAAGWYSSGAIQATNLSYPITFVEPPTVNVNLSPTTNTWALIVPGSTPGTTEETGIYQLLATYSHEFANRDYIFNYQVKGKWK